jgi:hypothetical protein
MPFHLREVILKFREESKYFFYVEHRSVDHEGDHFFESIGSIDTKGKAIKKAIQWLI